MDFSLKEFYITRIITGFFRCKINNQIYLIKQPDRHTRHIAQEVYLEALKDAELDGLYNDEELSKFLKQNDIWDDQKQKDLDQLHKDIEDYKVSLFKAAFKSEERKMIRGLLSLAKDKFYELSSLKVSYNHLSCSGTASTAKIRYLVGKSLAYEDGTKVWENDDFWKNTDPLLEDVTNVYISNRISDSEFRELARTEPWRSTWSCRKCEREVFGVPTVDLTDEQKSLVIWSSMYDSIYEHPSCPQQEIVDDDDLIDGWLILQKRERVKNQTKIQAEDLISNDRIKNSGEVFIIGQSKEDRERIESLNDDYAKNIKRQRMDLIQKKGFVNEADMPDTKLDLQMQANRMRG
jgi:hypothetical protein